MPHLFFERAHCRLALSVLALLLGLAVAAPAGAADLTLKAAIESALSDNKDLQAARLTVERARARLQQAGLPPNPRLEVGARNGAFLGSAGDYTASVGISQQFSIVGRIARQKDVAQVDVEMARAEIRQAELRLASDVASVFYRVLALKRQVDLRDRLIQVDQQLLKGTRSRFAAAEVSELDVNAAQLDLQRLQQERASLLSQDATERSRLDQLMGQAPTAAPVLVDETPDTAALPPLADQLRLALRLRPDLRLARLGADRARADESLARAQRWEDWTVGVGVEQSRQTILGAPPQDASRTVGVTLSIPLPLTNRNQGRIAETQAAGAQAAARVRALTFGIESEVTSDYAEAERLRHVVTGYQRDMLPLSDRNVRLAQQGYGQGLVSIVEVVQAQRQQGDLNGAYLNSLDQYFQALARLHAAIGAYLSDLGLNDE